MPHYSRMSSDRLSVEYRIQKQREAEAVIRKQERNSETIQIAVALAVGGCPASLIAQNARKIVDELRGGKAFRQQE